MEAVGGSPRTTMQRFGSGGMMILPWTKQLLSVVWEQVRLLLQVICYTFMAVFQMFRFEVHLRITDDTGEHIQHMSSTSRDPTDGFLLSSLFENNTNGDPFDLDSHSRSVISSLVNDELCCSLVDDFVSRATECLSENEELYLGEPCGWKHSWNVLRGSEGTYTDDLCPVAFTACLSGLYQKDIQKQDDPFMELEHNMSGTCTVEGWRPCVQEFGGQSSDSEVSWGGSDSSCVEGDKEESDRLWDLLTRSTDPYHPLHFTACVSSAASDQRKGQNGPREDQRKQMPRVSQSRASPFSVVGEQGSTVSFSEDEEEALWKSLSLNDDPYHPLNFRAPLQSPADKSKCGQTEDCVEGLSDCQHNHTASSKTSTDLTHARQIKTLLLTRRDVSHQCPEWSVEKPLQVPWKRLNKRSVSNTKKEIPLVKMVKFSPVVQVHKMRTWSFALQACRKGPWEEHARDRDRFQRRILDAEQAIGYCFTLSHREKLSAYQQRTLNK